MPGFDKFSLLSDEIFGSGVFTPDIVTPAQYNNRPAASPYQRLLFAILEDAINCCQRNYNAATVRRRTLFEEAQQWLFDSEDSSFMSCSMVCENLRIDPAGLRRCLGDWWLRATAGANMPRMMRGHSVNSTDELVRWTRGARAQAAWARESGHLVS
jgi:hypothetical protein